MKNTLASTACSLIGKTVRPAHGTERWAMANGKPRAGRVVGVFVPDLGHPYLVCKFGGEVDHMYQFELDVVKPAADATRLAP